MATFRFELDHKPTRNRMYNLYLMVSVGGKRTKKKTGIQLKRIEDFNPQCKGNNWIRANVPEAKVYNEQLRLLLVETNATYNELGKEGEVTSNHLIKALEVDSVSPSFIAYAKERAQEIYDAGGLRNHRKYITFLNLLEEFRRKRKMRDITIEDLTVELLNKFENFLHKSENKCKPGQKLHPNTIEVHFNVFRALVNHAIDMGIMDSNKNPFITFKYRGVKTVKDKLTQDEIQRIINLSLPEQSLIWHCKNMFLLSYYCAGIRIGDLLQLRWLNVTDSGRLQYDMGKNHKHRDLILVDQAIEILRHYHSEGIDTNQYIFPMLDATADYAKFITQADIDRMSPKLLKKLQDQISSKTALINKNLKKIAAQANINKPLTTHISRHSFASIAQAAGAESGAIKNILGHSDLATTERYLGNFDTAKTDDTLRSLFTKKEEQSPSVSGNIDEGQVLEYLRGKTIQEVFELLNKAQK